MGIACDLVETPAHSGHSPEPCLLIELQHCKLLGIAVTSAIQKRAKAKVYRLKFWDALLKKKCSGVSEFTSLQDHMA